MAESHSNFVTAKRLGEIKARLDARTSEIEAGIFVRTATLEFVDHASADIPDLVSTLKRAVELLQAWRKYHVEVIRKGCDCSCDICTFVKEFDHE